MPRLTQEFVCSLTGVKLSCTYRGNDGYLRERDALCFDEGHPLWAVIVAALGVVVEADKILHTRARVSRLDHGPLPSG